VIGSVASATEGYSGADLEKLCNCTFDVALERSEQECMEQGNSHPTGSILSRLKILKTDWENALTICRPSNSSVFGNSCYSGKDIREEFQPILAPIVKSLLPQFNNIVATDPSVGTRGLRVLSLWSSTPSNLTIINSHIIPAVLVTLHSDFTKIYGTEMDVASSTLQNVFNQISLTTATYKFLFLSTFNMFWKHLSSKLRSAFTEFLENARGTGLTLVITT